MGLDVSHGCWSGSYGSFGVYRDLLAFQIGITLDDMVGFGGDKSWDEYKDHDLTPLLDHSDCDGIITHEEAVSLAPALQNVLDNLDKNKILEVLTGQNRKDPDWWTQWFIAKTEQWITGLEEAIEYQEDVVFA